MRSPGFPAYLHARIEGTWSLNTKCNIRFLNTLFQSFFSCPRSSCVSDGSEHTSVVPGNAHFFDYCYSSVIQVFAVDRG